jgi:hypothetical protein
MSLRGIATDLFNILGRITSISSIQGAVTPVWLGVAQQPVSAGMEGRFWDRIQWKWASPWSLDVKTQDELWEFWCSETDMPLR